MTVRIVCYTKPRAERLCAILADMGHEGHVWSMSPPRGTRPVGCDVYTLAPMRAVLRAVKMMEEKAS